MVSVRAGGCCWVTRIEDRRLQNPLVPSGPSGSRSTMLHPDARRDIRRVGWRISSADGEGGDSVKNSGDSSTDGLRCPLPACAGVSRDCSAGLAAPLIFAILSASDSLGPFCANVTNVGDSRSQGDDSSGTELRGDSRLPTELRGDSRLPTEPRGESSPDRSESPRPSPGADPLVLSERAGGRDSEVLRREGAAPLPPPLVVFPSCCDVG
jgi:hypothetical protein